MNDNDGGLAVIIIAQLVTVLLLALILWRIWCRRHCHSWVIRIVVLQRPSSLLIEHDGLIHFDERPLDRRLRQSVPLQYLIIEPHQHFELCERCLPKVLV